MIINNYLNGAKKCLIPVTVFFICGYALYLRLAKLSSRVLWNDEYYQLNQMLGSFADLLKSLRYEYCAYLSGDLYLIYPFFKVFFYNKWGLAIPHVIATVAGFYLLYLICKRYLKSVFGFTITFLVLCFNVNLINHATEIRTYAVLPTFALGVFYALSLFIDSGLTLNRKNKVLIGLSLIFAIWFHAYGILMVFSLLAFILFSVRKSKYFSFALMKTVKFVAIISGITMPLWIYCVFGPHLEPKQYNFDTFYFIPSPMRNLPGFLKGIFGNLVGFKMFYILLAGMFFPFIFPLRDRERQISFLAFAVLLPIALLFLSDLKNHYWFVQRQFIWVMPLFAFFLGWSWEGFLSFLGDKINTKLRKQQP